MKIAKPLMNKFETLKSTINPNILQALRSLCVPNSNLNYGAYGHLIQHCTDNNLPRQAKQLHARIVLFSITPANFLASKLINFYSKVKQLDQARYLFDSIPQKNTFSFNALLMSYSFHDMYLDVLKLFSSLVWSGLGDGSVRIDEYTVTCVLKALSGSLCDLRLANEVHCFVLRCGFDEDVFVGNGLITFYAKCNAVGLARRLFDRMPEKDIVSWNSMIAGYSQGGYYEECKALYRKMIDSSHLRPNGVTLLSVLQACGQSNDLILGMEVHKFVVERQIEIDISLCNSLIGLYAKCGSLDYARELFEEMDEKDEVTYAALISGYMFHGFVDKALILFREMKQPGLSSWNALISGLFQNNQCEGILDLVQEMLARGLRPNVFDQSKSRSLILWTAIIAAYASHGDANAALSHFDEMLNNGIQPDNVTFTAVLTACAHSGMVDKAQRIFDAMLPEYGIEPSVEHHACMVGVLSRAGRLSEATELVSKMPIQPSPKVWGALLNGASVAGDAELGKFVCDHLFEMEPENTGNYIIMANLYSRAGRWEEADMVRERMKKIGLKKIPGTSWIETSGGLQSFVAKDRSSEKTEEIYMMLEGLLSVMREEGYNLQDQIDEETVYD
ncbi:hypothetical protein SLEP1_g17702 [Rubroshorea leprosula]|uniref:Pentatricopeptide repeat-containing protein n=1 Tax=Rubroshorea leprosula TaxID=152421 RepID=A0AAV5J5Q8_9ROSI|nr:hypothetical protein SLEP1_g17702 [Rubroshorea leprosula]